MAIENTLILIKPDGMERRLAGLVIDRLEAAGLDMAAAKVVRVSEALARAHYDNLKGQPFCDSVVNFLRGENNAVPGKRVIAMVYRGENAIAAVRALVGATNPEKAAPETIRGAFGRIRNGIMENVIHASGNRQDADREIELWFKPEDIINW